MRFHQQNRTVGSIVVAVGLIALSLTGCAHSVAHERSVPSHAAVTEALRSKIQTIVFIYAENQSFDKLFGRFPGANGIPGVNSAAIGSYQPQRDRDGTVLAKLPPTWGGVTAPGEVPVVTQAESSNLPNRPFAIESTFRAPLSLATVTRDLYHRFFEEQMEIAGGSNSGFAAWSDAGGLAMGTFDGRDMAIWHIAQQYVLADNFFQAAFGGSFLNHQYLICACAPEYPDADTAPAKPSIAVLDRNTAGGYLPALTLAPSSPQSALDGPPVFVTSGNLTPKNYFGDGTFRVVNTMQPPYQPSGNPPAVDGDPTSADPGRATTLPPQTATTIGDLLSAKRVSWAWFAGAWNQALADRTAIYNGGNPNFQPHHQPFNYYASYAPGTAARAAHLKDYNDFIAEAAAGTLPHVSFYKPSGDFNEHPGYTSVEVGDAHLEDVIARLRASPQWSHMLIVITYDENGGAWDHVAPPQADLLGPGNRIPAIVVSPFAKHGFVDHTQYDTASIDRLIIRRFDLPTLPGLAARDAALRSAGNPKMGDLTGALDL